MFKIIFSLVMFLGFNSLAQETQRTYIRLFSSNLCSSWNYMGSTTGMSGYVCSGYPMSATFPDGYSTQAAVTELENKILMLEEKIKAIEAKITK